MTPSSTATPRSWISRSDTTPTSAAARSHDSRRAAYSPSTCPCRSRESISSNATPDADGSKGTGDTLNVRKSISSAVDAAPNSEDSWSSKPVGAPTYSFSARWASRAWSSRSICSPDASAPSAAHSSAADDDSPDPIGTSLAIDIVPPGTGCPAIRSAHTTPAT